MRTALVAIGGNSLLHGRESVEQQAANLRRTAKAVVGLLREGFHLVLTHGNGPQVGAALLRSERSSDQVYGQSLDVCDACTQGEIGYLLEQALRNEIEAAGLPTPVVSLITESLVDEKDKAFKKPSKPIGPYYTAEEAKERTASLGWTMVKEANRGYRRTVASPEPIDILELETIRQLMTSGTLVIAAGGGGIPVVRTPEGLKGVEAVIDKDRASALLATKLGIELFLIATDTDYVYLDHATLLQRPIRFATASEMGEFARVGSFPPGNMGPKIEAAIRFLQMGGQRVVITDDEHLEEAMKGTAGTQILPDMVEHPAMGNADKFKSFTTH